ncbi:MAG: hypothetical protein R2795_13270 [Saprospiraceae bacterium]
MKSLQWFWVLSILFFCGQLPAQDMLPTGKADFLTFGAGFPLHTVRDNAHSVLRYRGTGSRLFFRYEKYNGKYLSRFGITIDNASLKTGIKPKRDVSSKAKLNDVQFNWGWFARMGDAADGMTERRYIGFTYNIHLNNRSYPLPTNNTTGVLIHSGLGVSLLDTRIVESAKWTANTWVDIPLINAVFRPNYTGLPDLLHVQKVKTKDVLKGFELGTVNKLFKISVGAEFDRFRQPWRTERFAWEWQFIHTPLPRYKPLSSTSGSLMYGLRVKR